MRCGCPPRTLAPMGAKWRYHFIRCAHRGRQALREAENPAERFPRNESEARPMDAERRERYSRQILFAEIGEQGQERLCASSAVLIGCGALGSALANLLVRAGVGRLR